jgi:hypothetical protein
VFASASFEHCGSAGGVSGEYDICDYGMQEKLKNFKCDVVYMPMCCKRLLEPDPVYRMTAEEAYNILKIIGGGTFQIALCTADTEQRVTGSGKRVKLDR